MKSKIALAILFATGILLFCNISAAACSCPDINYRQAFRDATAVFVGEALEWLDNPDSKENGWLIVKFKVERTWKGSNSPEVVIPTTVGSQFHCGLGMVEPGKRYLVYAYGKDRVMSGGCGPSWELRPANMDYAEKQIGQLDGWWFRLRARLLPF